ncbi:ATP-binding cassette, sub-C (CFTR MRP), member 9, partial [Modicella reniformis]
MPHIAQMNMQSVLGEGLLSQFSTHPFPPPSTGTPLVPQDGFCGRGEGWGPISRDRYDLTLCFKFSVLLGFFSIMAAVAFVVRIMHLRVHRTPHHLGRTAWIYWPTQASMGLVAILALINACLRYWHDDGSLAAILGYLCFGTAWIIALVLNHDEHRYTIRSSDLIYSFYFLSIVFLGAIVLDPQTGGNSQFTLTMGSMICLTLGFVVEAWPRTNTKIQQQSHGTSAYDKANFFSRCTFHFYQPIISLSVKKTITMDDLQNQLPNFIKTAESYEDLERQWNKNVAKSRETHKKVSLFWTIIQ